MNLPHLFGTSLSGKAWRYPLDLPDRPVALVFGFAHEARGDVGRWKRALEARGLPWLSLPCTVDDVPPHALDAVADSMRAHVPEAERDRILLVHRGGGALMERLGWRHDAHAKVLVADVRGDLLASHGHGAFTDEALEVVAHALTRGPGHPTLEA